MSPVTCGAVLEGCAAHQALRELMGSGPYLATLEVSCETIAWSFAHGSASIQSMTSDHEDTSKLAADARQLIASFDSVLMSTVGADGAPHASYAPTVATKDGCFYIYTSDLSRHTANLRATGLVSILFIENECDAKQAFARRRVNFDCQAELVERDSPIWLDVLDIFAARFGDVLELIRPLRDFTLFRLEPKRGTYVRGFGRAYRIEGARVVTLHHIGPEQLKGTRD